jgi:hypothetical protein
MPGTLYIGAMQQQTMFLCAAALAIVVAACVEVMVGNVPGSRPSMKVAPGVMAGAMFMGVMHRTGVAPGTAALSFTLPWALAHLLSSETYGASTVRERVKRGALAAACGGLGVMATLGD